jgi:hypothetical protein
MGKVAYFSRIRRWLTFGSVIALTTAAGWAQFPEIFEGQPEHPAIGYSQPSHDPAAELNRKIQEGAVELRYEETAGYLRAVLEALHIPVESQIVPYSKTSVQSYRITPKNPRSLFFNDSVVVGWVNGGFIELAAQDPRQGVIFYTLGKSAVPALSRVFTAFSRPYFQRTDSCLGCHVSYATLGVPGTLVRSVFPDANGSPLYQAGSFVTDHRLPMNQRWGGWYVTGKFTNGRLRPRSRNLLRGSRRKFKPCAPTNRRPSAFTKRNCGGCSKIPRSRGPGWTRSTKL